MNTIRANKLRCSPPISRGKQFYATITHRHAAEIDHRIRTLLDNDEQWQLVARLSTFDRAHHLRVYDGLRSRGYDDADLLRAALLHDVGKSNGVHRVRLWHRVLRVLCKRAWPSLWTRLTSGQSIVLAGCNLAEHHARLGSELVARAGGSERCCTFIADHERSLPTGDTLLDALIEADELA